MNKRDKKKLIISYKNISHDIIEAIKDQYPEGFQIYIKKIELGPEKFFHAFEVETDDTLYLVKVDVKIDTKGALDRDGELVFDVPDIDEHLKDDDIIADSDDDDEEDIKSKNKKKRNDDDNDGDDDDDE